MTEDPIRILVVEDDEGESVVLVPTLLRGNAGSTLNVTKEFLACSRASEKTRLQSRGIWRKPERFFTFTFSITFTCLGGKAMAEKKPVDFEAFHDRIRKLGMFIEAVAYPNGR